MDPVDIIGRYRHLRALCTRHQAGAMSCVADRIRLGHAQQIGVAIGDEIFVGNDDPEMKLVADLALYTAKRGRSRAIARYARSVGGAPGSDDARVLDALCAARFSIWQIERRHAVAGVVLKDLVREQETWLMDEAMPFHGEPGHCFAARVCWPDEFGMICLTVVPMDKETLEDTLFELGPHLRRADAPQLIEDARFATSLYRVAIDAGAMEFIADL